MDGGDDMGAICGSRVRCWVLRRDFEERARNAGNASHEIFRRGGVAAGLEVIWCHLLDPTPASDMRTQWLWNEVTLKFCLVSNSIVSISNVLNCSAQTKIYIYIYFISAL